MPLLILQVQYIKSNKCFASLLLRPSFRCNPFGFKSNFFIYHWYFFILSVNHWSKTKSDVFFDFFFDFFYLSNFFFSEHVLIMIVFFVFSKYLVSLDMSFASACNVICFGFFHKSYFIWSDKLIENLSGYLQILALVFFSVFITFSSGFFLCYLIYLQDWFLSFF